MTEGFYPTIPQRAINVLPFQPALDPELVEGRQAQEPRLYKGAVGFSPALGVGNPSGEARGVSTSLIKFSFLSWRVG